MKNEHFTAVAQPLTPHYRVYSFPPVPPPTCITNTPPKNPRSTLKLIIVLERALPYFLILLTAPVQRREFLAIWPPLPLAILPKLYKLEITSTRVNEAGTPAYMACRKARRESLVCRCCLYRAIDSPTSSDCPHQSPTEGRGPHVDASLYVGLKNIPGSNFPRPPELL